MEWYEILIIVFACAFVLAIVIWQIVRRAKGKSGCDCGGNCSACCGCSHAPKQEGSAENTQNSLHTKSP